MKRFEYKRPGETRTVSFRFTRALGEGETLVSGSATVVAATWKGADADPAALINGAPAVVGDRVVQSITGGLDRVQYLLKATVTTSGGQTLILDGVLPVEHPR